MNTKKISVLAVIIIILVTNISIKTKHERAQQTAAQEASLERKNDPFEYPPQPENAQMMYIMTPTHEELFDSENSGNVVEEYPEEYSYTMPATRTKQCCSNTALDPYAPCDVVFEKEIEEEKLR